MKIVEYGFSPGSFIKMLTGKLPDLLETNCSCLDSKDEHRLGEYHIHVFILANFEEKSLPFDRTFHPPLTHKM